MADTKTLLEQYVRNDSEAAFRELVSRYIGLVYATALRLVGGDACLAEDVTQSVFVHLARQAWKLPEEVSLGGWLHRDTCHVAATLMRSERRRQARERQAMEMNALQDHTEANLERLAPVLDEALNRLEPEERTAIMFRFFDRLDFRAVGVALGATEDAARMRVSRALDKLQTLLRHRGITLSAAALGTALASESLTAAPGNLAAKIAATALAEAATGGGSIVLLLQLMAKLKTVGLVGLALLVATGIGFYFGSQNPEHPQAPHRSSHGALAGGTVEQAKATPPRLRTSKPTKPPERFSDIQDAIANLWQALREKPVDDNGYVSPHKVDAALRAFGPNLQEAIPTLLEGLQDASDQVQMCSAWGFNFMGRHAEPAMSALLDWARSETQPHKTRVFAIHALGGMALEYGTRRTSADAAFVVGAVPGLITLLQDRDIELRADAASALGNMGSFAKEAVPVLVELLAYSASPQEAQTVAERQDRSSSALDESKLNYQMDRLTRCIRSSAAQALEQMGQDAKAAVPQLSALLSTPDTSVRAKAAIALWRIAGRTDMAEVLATCISDPVTDPAWQERVDVLGEMGPAAAPAVPALLQLCKFITPSIREPVLAALRKIDASAVAN